MLTLMAVGRRLSVVVAKPKLLCWVLRNIHMNIHSLLSMLDCGLGTEGEQHGKQTEDSSEKKRSGCDVI